MARQNGQFTWVTPCSNSALGDDASSTSTKRIFVATERVTVVQFGAIATDSTHVPSSAFAFKLVKRTGGDSTSDFVVPAFKATFAAEGGPGGDSSNQNFDNANQLANGIVTNAGALLAGGKALRAFCEVSLDKGDMLIVQVTTGGGASSVAAFYAIAYADGSGLIEPNDVDSN